MSQALYEMICNVAEGRVHHLRFVGGAAAVTKVFGNGITIAYTATGRVTVTWAQRAQNPGVFVGVLGYSFQATTPGDVKTFTLVAEPYNATTRSIVLNLYEAGTLADLAALEWLSVSFLFKETRSST